MRTLALGEILKKDFQCAFYTQTPSHDQIRLIEKTCNEWYSLLEGQEHFEKFYKVLVGDEIVVLDNYYFSSQYQKSIKNIGCKLVSIDDIYDKHYYSDIVINHAPGIDNSLFNCEPYTKLLLGLDYAVINQAFKVNENENRDNDSAFDVMVAFGGSNNKSIINKVLNAVNSAGNYKVAVVLGRDNNIDPDQYAENFKFYLNVSQEDVAFLMKSSKLGILPASTLAIEAVSARLPLICGHFVKNQESIYNGLVESGAATGIGEFNEATDDNIKTAINSTIKQEVLETITNNQKLICDNKSPKRLLEEVAKLCS